MSTVIPSQIKNMNFLSNYVIIADDNTMNYQMIFQNLAK